MFVLLRARRGKEEEKLSFQTCLSEKGGVFSAILVVLRCESDFFMQVFDEYSALVCVWGERRGYPSFHRLLEESRAACFVWTRYAFLLFQISLFLLFGRGGITKQENLSNETNT